MIWMGGYTKVVRITEVESASRASPDLPNAFGPLCRVLSYVIGLIPSANGVNGVGKHFCVVLCACACAFIVAACRWHERLNVRTSVFLCLIAFATACSSSVVVGGNLSSGMIVVHWHGHGIERDLFDGRQPGYPSDGHLWRSLPATLVVGVALPRGCKGSARVKIVEMGGEPAVGEGE
jgi:uncharacterized protein YodC (DUF2158 family)